MDIFAREDASIGDLWLFGFDLFYPGSLLILDGVTIGSSFLDEGDGATYIGGSILNPLDANAGDNIHLASLFFTAGLIQGFHKISIIGDPLGSQPDRGAYYSNTGTGNFSDLPILGETNITIHQAVVNPVPEPGTFILMGLGLLGLLRIKRKIIE